MKVGTDAVLLGAWCPAERATRMLDIGTGSGVIALMLAQRSGPAAQIDAVELHERDCRQATENVKNSPWPGKVQVIHARIQDFQATPYDLIVCNPPFFTQSLLPPDPRRAQVRHDSELNTPDLLQAVRRLLRPEGLFSLIVPAQGSAEFIQEATTAGFHLHRHTHFHTRKHKIAERSLLTLGLTPGTPLRDNLLLYEEGDQKSAAYLGLTGDFYL